MAHNEFSTKSSLHNALIKNGFLAETVSIIAESTITPTWISTFAVFGRLEDVRESFQRLYPVRIATMHARFLTPDDELLLLLETRRVLKAIGL